MDRKSWRRKKALKDFETLDEAKIDAQKQPQKLRLLISQIQGQASPLMSTSEPESYEKYGASAPFRFVIGSEKKEFTIHADPIAIQSPKLKALVRGCFREAKEHCVVWAETEVDTFFRFGQFVYSGCYEAAEPQHRCKSSSRPESAGYQSPEAVHDDPASALAEKMGSLLGVPAEDDQSQDATLSPKSTSLGPTRCYLWVYFLKCYPLFPQTAGREDPKCGPSEALDYTAVFLSHAKMYVFADYHGIGNLQDLALRQLFHALAWFELTEPGLRDIAELTKYCFENATSHNGKPDRLAELVAMYGACHLEHLWRHEAYRSLVNFPELSDALFTIMVAASPMRRAK